MSTRFFSQPVLFLLAAAVEIFTFSFLSNKVNTLVLFLVLFALSAYGLWTLVKLIPQRIIFYGNKALQPELATKEQEIILAGKITAGRLLAFPGLITGGLGLLLLVEPIQHLAAPLTVKYVQKKTPGTASMENIFRKSNSEIIDVDIVKDQNSPTNSNKPELE